MRTILYPRPSVYLVATSDGLIYAVGAVLGMKPQANAVNYISLARWRW